MQALELVLTRIVVLTCQLINRCQRMGVVRRELGYQEAPSVSEVAVWFIYLIPALVAFALPPRAGATASRSA